jgi:hypothetical protein
MNNASQMDCGAFHLGATKNKGLTFILVYDLIIAIIQHLALIKDMTSCTSCPEREVPAESFS